MDALDSLDPIEVINESKSNKNPTTNKEKNINENTSINNDKKPPHPLSCVSNRDETEKIVLSPRLSRKASKKM